MRYRNSNARHHHETETKKNMFNLRKVDTFIRHEKGLTNARMQGANNTKVSGQAFSQKIVSSLKNG